MKAQGFRLASVSIMGGWETEDIPFAVFISMRAAKDSLE